MHVLIIPGEHFVTHRYPTGGIFQLDQARALRDAGHTVGIINIGVISPRFLLRTYPYARYEIRDGIPIYRQFERSIAPQRYSHPRRAVALQERVGLQLFERYVRSHGHPDVVHAHDVLLAASTARAIRVAHGIPYVITEHSSTFLAGTFDARARRIAAACVSDAACVTAVSRSLGNHMRSVLQMTENVVDTLPNVVGAEFLQTIHRTRGRAEFTFLAVASLDENKDHATLLRAFSLRFAETSASLRIAGTGPLLRSLQRLARELRISQQVTFLGQVNRDAVHREMANADCFVLCARKETFGVVLIEALASGLPVIATRSGGPEDIVRRDVGVLFDAGDVPALVEAMEYVSSHRDQYDPRALRANCLKRYGPEGFVSKACDLYSSAIGARPTERGHVQ